MYKREDIFIKTRREYFILRRQFEILCFKSSIFLVIVFLNQINGK